MPETDNIIMKHGLRADSFKEVSDFQALVSKDPKGVDNVAKKQVIDIAKTFRNMEAVASLLRVAHSAAGNFACSVPIAKILCRYQSVVNETETCCFKFVSLVVASLKKHNLALKCAKKGKPERSLELLSKCADIAGEMAREAGDMSNMAQELIVMSEEAFVSAMDDKSLTDKERIKAQKRMQFAKEKAEELNKLVEQLAEDESKAAEEERIFAKKADKEREKAFIKSLVSIGANALGGIANAVTAATPTGAAATSTNAFSSSLMQTTHKNSDSDNEQDEDKGKKPPADGGKAEESKKSEPEGSPPANGDTGLDQLEAAANQRKWEIRKLQREKNSELAGVLTEMKHLTASENDLLMAIKSLETTIWAMGKVKTTFDLTKKFWIQVQDRCNRLADIDDIKDEIDLADCTEEMTSAISDNAAYWIQLGCLNMAAYNSIAACAHETNNFMENLPRGHEERQEIVRAVSDKIIAEIKEEDESVVALN